jgi:hypothetical protein
MDENNFRSPNELLKFITKYKNHKCSCNCKPIYKLRYEDLKENLEYKSLLDVNSGLVNTCKYNSEKIQEMEKELEQIKKNKENISESIESHNEEYSCKNECCCDYVYSPDTYCSDCVLYVKKCKECDDEYSDKDTNCKKCFDCRNEDNNEESEDEEDEVNSNSSISDTNDISKNNIIEDKPIEEKVDRNVNIDANKYKIEKEIINNNKINDIFSSLKNIKNVNINKTDNKIINNINDIGANRLDKYKLMINLYEKLYSEGITESKDFTKYIKNNKVKEYTYLINDSKSRRLFNKCKKLYEIKDFIDINIIVSLRILDKIFSLDNVYFEILKEKIKTDRK